jgi:hypothetical protein
MEELLVKPKKPKDFFNWDDKEFILNYKNRVQKKLADGKFRHLITNLNNCQIKENVIANSLIDSIHKGIQCILIDCARKAHNELNLTIRKQLNKERNKRNFWWSGDLKEIYIKMKELYVTYRDSEFDPKHRNEYLEYVKLFRLHKRFNIKLKRDKNLQLINQMFSMSKTQFWRKVKKLDKCSTQIDAKIVEISADYEKLFNQKNDSKSSKEKASKEFFEKLASEYEMNQSSNEKIEINKYDLKQRIKSLNNKKAIGIAGVSNEMLKYALLDETGLEIENDSLIVALSGFYNGMINYKYSPNFFNVSIIKPLVKDSNKPTDDVNNLRGIGVSDVISNLYESVLDGIVRSYAITNDKQFGFKSNNSCSHAILALKQILNLAKHLKIRLYISAIDAAKAFDKVNRDILWSRLLEMQVPLIYVIAIEKYYKKSVMIVELEGDLSKMFKTSLGVRQGGVLSPLLFCIYIDNLLESLQEMELGVKIGKVSIDVLAYADDILIITHTKLNM